MRFLVLAVLCLATSAQARDLPHDETIIRWDTERLSIVRGGQGSLVYQHHEEKNEGGEVVEANQRKTSRKHLADDPNPRPPGAGLEAVHVQGDQLFKTNLKTGKTEALELGKVLAAGQDTDGHWWVVSQRGTSIGLARIPVGMNVQQRKPLLGHLEAGIGHYKLVFPDQSTLTLTDFGEQRAAEKACGGWNGKYLCDEAMGWTSRKTWTWNPEKELLQEWGIPIPSQPPKSIIASAPPQKPFRSPPCMCWGESYDDCGNSTPLGSTGMSLIVNDVECGDMTHPSCVVQSADKKSYASYSIEDLAKSGGLRWSSAAEISPKNRPSGSCGPFYFSVDGRWVTDGKGVFCSLDEPAVCTAKLKGEFLGTTGLPLRVTELP